MTECSETLFRLKHIFPSRGGAVRGDWLTPRWFAAVAQTDRKIGLLRRVAVASATTGSPNGSSTAWKRC